MSTPGNVVNVPKPEPPALKYSRARCLLEIISSASLQLRQDADNLEQEDLALASRIISIIQAATEISEHDPLLHPPAPFQTSGVAQEIKPGTPATQIVHWPGKDVPACEKHAAQLKGVGEAMGFTVSASPCFEPLNCTNCDNNAKRAANASV